MKEVAVHTTANSTQKWLHTSVFSTPLRRRLAHGAFWSIAGSLVSQGLTLVSFVLLAKTLGTSGFGELGIMQTTVAMMAVVGGFRLGAASTKFIASHFRTDCEKTGRIMGLVVLLALLTSGLTSAALAMFARPLAEQTLAAPHLTSAIRVLSLLLFAAAWCEVFDGMLAGFEAFKRNARINLIIGVTTCPLLLSGAYLGGVLGMVWSLAALRGIHAILAAIETRSVAMSAGVRVTFTGCLQEYPTLFHFCVPAIGTGLVLAPVTWISQALLVNQPHGYHEMGLFNAANQWFAALVFLPNMIIGSTLPIFAERLALNQVGQARKIFLMLLKLNVILFVPIAVLAATSETIMGLYGRPFVVGWPTLTITLLTAGVMAADKTIQYVALASGKMWLNLSFHFCWAGVFLGTAFYLIPNGYGSFGLATARLFAFLVQAMLGCVLAAQILKAKNVN